MSADERAKIAALKRAQREQSGADPEQVARETAARRLAAAEAKRVARAKAKAEKAELVRAQKAQVEEQRAERAAAELARAQQEKEEQAEQADRAAEVAAENEAAAEQLETERLERIRAEKERAEAARLEREQLEQERLERQREADKAAAAKPAKPKAKPKTAKKTAVETIVVDDEAAARERLRRQLPRDAVQPAADAPTAVKISGLVKEFSDGRGVHGIDLEIPAGCFYGLVGPNGAGKSTVISILAGLQKADAGTIEIAGHDLASEPRAAKAVMGVLPDRLRTFDRLTGWQLARYVGQLRGLKASEIDARTRELARAFDLESALGRVIADYSSGMTKKLLLATALLHAPKVLVLDEPFEAVDPASAEVILGVLRVYVQGGGTVVLSTHGMDLIERVCAQVAVINQGHVLASGDVDELRGEQSLESRFVELIDYSGDGGGLDWLYASSN